MIKMEKINRKISIGRGLSVAPLPFTGSCLPGGGYGLNKKITSIVDDIANNLHQIYPEIEFEKRCNSDGESGGTYLHPKHDMAFGVGVKNIDGTLFYDALFETDILTYFINER